jgi:ornithine cyclodeaminase/alanine dehydrogenase
VVLILSHSDLERIVSMKETIDALERAFRELVNRTARLPIRTALSVPEARGWVGIMPAYLGGMRSLSTKIVTVYDENLAKGLPTTMATIILNDPETGKVLAVMEGGFVTAMRTGGVGGLAAKYLSRKNSRTVGIFGAGVQARSQLIALKEVRDIRDVYVYDPVLERARSFGVKMGREVGIPIHVSAKSADLVKKSDIIVTVSTSKIPVFDGRLLRPGTHLNVFGSFKPTDREVDDEAVKRSTVIVDLREAALQEAGDLIVPLKAGIITEHHIRAELGEIITKSKPGRISERDITLFKSVGLGIQDCAIACLAYKNARKQRVGLEVDLLA